MRRHADRLAAWVDAVVVMTVTGFLVWRLRPGLLLAPTLPAGGDLSSHSWGPDFVARALLPELAGWSWDWFAGFPAYRFYPVLPALLTVGLDQVFAYGVAMKITIVAGVVALPVMSYAFARAWRLPFPTPALVAVAAFVFCFDDGHDFGWNLRSTIAGEHSHAIGMTLAVGALALLAPVVRDGRLRVTAAVVMAAAMCAHPLAAGFVGIGALAVVVVHLAPDARVTLRRVLPVLGCAAALAGIWWIPFLAWRGEMTSPDLPRGTGIANLATFGVADVVVLALAVVGVVRGWRNGYRVVGVLAAVALVHSGLYLVLPQGHLENLRLVPGYLWCRLVLAAIGVGLLVATGRHARPGVSRATVSATAVALGAVAAALLVVAALWRVGPFGTGRPSFHDASIAVAMAGYERNPQYPEYRRLIRALDGLGRDRGCGRVAWTTDVATTDFGTVSIDLVPYWTRGCITSMAGLYYDSSATTPMVSLTESLLGIRPMRFAPEVPYRGFDLDAGVRHLQYLGVRYFAARTSTIRAAAARHPALTEVASTPVWSIFEVAGSELVAPLGADPLVFDVPGLTWAVGSAQYTEGSPVWDQVVLTDAGPPEWPRLRSRTLPSTRMLPEVRIDRIRLGPGRVSFRVDRPGVPVLVRASFFPTWVARGADGPYRAAGNMMVVTPTRRSVVLEHGVGAVDVAATGSFVLGLVGVGILGVHDRRRRQGARAAPHP